MVRKYLVMGTMAALSSGLLVQASSVWAGPTPIDVSNDQITCNTVIGSIKIKPALTTSGSSPTIIQVKGTVDGCTDTTNNAVKILASGFKGVLNGSSNSCLTLLGPSSTTGSITVKWKADSSTPIAQKSSTLNVTTLTGGTFSPGGAFASASYGQFQITSGTSITAGGAFTGGDGGTTSTATLVTGEDVGSLATACASSKGLKALVLGIGTLTLK